MKHLLLQDNGNKKLWSSGWASFLSDQKVGLRLLPVAVKCRLEKLGTLHYALLDTGAEWSVIGGEIASLLKERLGSPIQSQAMHTHQGKIVGDIHRLGICFLAEQNPDNDLTVDGTILVAEEWEGPIVLGYRGLLERMRFAIDPGVAPGEQIFYFGANE